MFFCVCVTVHNDAPANNRGAKRVIRIHTSSSLEYYSYVHICSVLCTRTQSHVWNRSLHRSHSHHTNSYIFVYIGLNVMGELPNSHVMYAYVHTLVQTDAFPHITYVACSAWDALWRLSNTYQMSLRASAPKASTPTAAPQTETQKFHNNVSASTQNRPHKQRNNQHQLKTILIHILYAQLWS